MSCKYCRYGNLYSLLVKGVVFSMIKLGLCFNIYVYSITSSVAMGSFVSRHWKKVVPEFKKIYLTWVELAIQNVKGIAIIVF